MGFEGGGDSGAMAVDVLIVGFGPVGATLANLLGRYGVQTLVVDKATQIYAAPRAIALDNEALRILQLAGLEEGAFDTVAIPKVRMHSPMVGEFACFNCAGAIDGHPRLVTFYQPELEQVLRARLAAHASVRTETGVELLGFEQDEAGVDASLRRSDGGVFSVRARYLIGVDGASSLVRRLIGQEFVGETYPEEWLIVDARNVPTPIDHVEFICDPARPTPHMVAPGNRERWEFMLQPGETRSIIESDASIAALLSPWGRPEDLHIERKAVYCFHARAAGHFAQGRVFLAGDAAHITPPFIGQGLVSGLRDAANLAWKLAWVLRGFSAPALLDSYDTERRPHALAMIRLAQMMGKLVMPRNTIAALLIHSTMRLLNRIPMVRRFIAEQRPKPANILKSGLFVPGRSPTRLIRGGMLPQGLLRGADGRIVLSDNALGMALTLVGFGVDPLAFLALDTVQTLQAAGGIVVQICHRGQHLGANAHGRAWDDVANSFVPATAPPGWVALVRPDRTVVNDGPVESVDRIVREGLTALGALQPQPVLIPATAGVR